MKQTIEIRPSNAHRWLNCHGQPRAVLGLPDKSSKDADKGTVAHGLLELALRLDLSDDDLGDYLGKKIKGCPPIEVDEVMLRGVGHALDFTRSYCVTNPKADYHIERLIKIKLGKYQTQGTADIVIDNLPAELVIEDYKNGFHTVDAEENPQLTLYALGYVQEHRARVKPKTRIRLVIVQPNAQDGDPPVREYHVDPAFLLYFTDQAIKAAEACHEPAPERKAGDWCRFCRAAGLCKEYASYILSQAGLEFEALDPFEELTMPDTENMTDEDLAHVLRAMDRVRAWLTSVEEAAIERLLAGEQIPGYKCVPSRPQRKWDDEQQVIAMVQKLKLPMDVFAPRSPLSPAQLERVGKAALYIKFKGHVTHNPVEPRVAPESDSRKPFIPGQEFSRLETK